MRRNSPQTHRRIRDQRLLDALEAVDPAPYSGTVWWSVERACDPLACWRSGGRWGPAAVGGKEYTRSQEVAEACAFLGADGLLVPSARVPASNNLIVFCEQETRIVKEVVRSHGVVDLS